MPEIKQVVVVNSKVDMSRGKMAAQVAHASLGAYRKADAEKISDWEETGMRKVILESGEREMEDLYSEAERKNLSAFLVKDAGRTELKPGTVTALGIGPAKSSEIDEVSGGLDLVE